MGQASKSYHSLHSGIATHRPTVRSLCLAIRHGYRVYEYPPQSGTLSVYLVQVVTSMVISGCKAENLLNRGL